MIYCGFLWFLRLGVAALRLLLFWLPLKWLLFSVTLRCGIVACEGYCVGINLLFSCLFVYCCFGLAFVNSVAFALCIMRY